MKCDYALRHGRDAISSYRRNYLQCKIIREIIIEIIEDIFIFAEYIVLKNSRYLK